MNRAFMIRTLGVGLMMLYGLQFLCGCGERGRLDSSSSIKTAKTTKKTAKTTKAIWTLSDKQTINHKGLSRSYRVYAPDPPPKTPCPAVLLLHGHAGSADQLMGVKGRQSPYRLWLPIAERTSLILIIPDGLTGPDGKQGWNDARNLASNPKSDDVAFLTRLVETVSNTNPIDMNRVFAMGTSNGGHMALKLAAETPEKFAAVAAVAAANPEPIFAHKPQHPISVLLINGTADRILPYNGGKMIRDRGEVQSTDESIQFWVGHNGCDETPRNFEYPDGSQKDGSTASLATYTNAKTGVEVSLLRILGGGHAEPSEKQPYSRLFLAIVGAQNRDIEMAEEIAKFFEGKSRNPDLTQ